jgi:hypothetical protein
MQRDTPDEVYNNLTSTNQRLMREMEDYLASVDSSFSAAAPRPPPRPSYVDQIDQEWMQQSHNCSVIFERSTEDCDNDLSHASLQQSADEKQGQHMEDEDSFHNRLQRIDETIDTALNSLQSNNSKGKTVQEYEYYNDPKYQKKKHRERSSASVDDDSLVAMAKRLDDASVISDPSVIVGTREKGIPNLTAAAAQQFRSYEYNRKSSNNSAKKRPARDHRSGHTISRRSSRGSCTSSTSSSSCHSQRTREVSSSSNTTRYKTDNDAKTSSASTAGRARAFGTHQSSKSHFKDAKGASSNRNAFVDDRRSSENCRQPQPPPPKTAPSGYHRKNSSSRFAEAKHHLQGDLKSTRREEEDNTGACDGPWAIPRQCYSDFRTVNNNSTPQDSDNDDDGDESDHTEIFYETDDDEGSYEEDEDEYDPRAVGTSVADAVKDLNDRRPLKKFTGLFAKKNKSEEDNWSIMTQRESL